MLTHITVLCALRIAGIGSWRNFCKSSLARKLILFTLIDSWLFAYASAVLLFGVGSSLNDVSRADHGLEMRLWRRRTRAEKGGSVSKKRSIDDPYALSFFHLLSDCVRDRHLVVHQ